MFKISVLLDTFSDIRDKGLLPYFVSFFNHIGGKLMNPWISSRNQIISEGNEADWLAQICSMVEAKFGGFLNRFYIFFSILMF